MFTDGSIPAGAGEPSYPDYKAVVVGVYPRGCGGTIGGLPKLLAAQGLSPRVRGNRIHVARVEGECGSIPAGAGEPSYPDYKAVVVGVYPRGCGGTIGGLPKLLAAQGLSPRVRGNHRYNGWCLQQRRSIPAGAGEPDPPSKFALLKTVYPRGCGGTIPLANAPRSVEGLSPRVRGNQNHVGPGQVPGRSIPAGAGEPLLPQQPQLDNEVYPRGCGGTCFRVRYLGLPPGLSPRVRGNPTYRFALVADRRSIPAGAGEPSWRTQHFRLSGVYPRGCGGTRSRCNQTS